MRDASRHRLLAGVCLLSFWLTGCAAFHPVDGVPARYLPPEMKVGERSGRRTIDLSLLRQTPPSAHRIDGGDVLAIYVEGFVGKSSDPPPVFFPTNNEVPPSFGLPYPVREDGTISLPQVGTINLRGLTVAQAEERVKQAYLSPRELIHPENNRVLVNLQRPRQYRVLVIRQDSRTEPMSTSGTNSFNLGMVKRGTGKVVSLPAYNNDVLNALTATDGLPGLDAENAVYIIRNRGNRTGGTLDQQWPTDLDPSVIQQFAPRGNQPAFRGQSPAGDSSSLHRSPLDRGVRIAASQGDASSTGSLHEPRIFIPTTPVISNAYYEGATSRSVDHANWNYRGDERDGSTRPLPLPGHASESNSILPVAAWNEVPSPNRVFAPPMGMSSNAARPGFDASADARARQLYESGAWAAPPTSTGTTYPPADASLRNAAQFQSQPQFTGGMIERSGSVNQIRMQYQPEPQQGLMPSSDQPSNYAPEASPDSAATAQTQDPSGTFQPGISSPGFGAGLSPMSPPSPNGQLPFLESGHTPVQNLGIEGRHVIRIPIRLGPGETADIREEDVILQDGDIVFIESRDSEVFYTAGLLGGGQFTLPRDYDLDVLQALALASSGNNSGASRSVGGVSALNNDVSISPSTVIILRKLPDGGEVPIRVDLYRARTDLSERIIIQPGDYILLQYTPIEAVAAFLERHLLEGALFGLAAQGLQQGN